MSTQLLIVAAGYRIKFCTPTIALIRSPRGDVYRVDLAAGKCGCRWGLGNHEKPCKHLVAIRELAALLSW